MAFLMASAALAQTPSMQSTIVARDAEVAEVKIHYLTAGQGPAVILLHGYTQTSRIWEAPHSTACGEIPGHCA